MRALLLLLPLLVACPSTEEPPVVGDDDDATEEPTPEPVNPWNPDGEGRDPWDIARNFSFEAHDGTFVLRDEWTGEDSYMFVQNLSGNTMDLWGSDLAEMLRWSPPNVHWFFVSNRPEWAEDYSSLLDRIDAALAELDSDGGEYGSQHWYPRLHVATGPRGEVGGLVADVMSGWSTQFGPSGGWSATGFGIDRLQRLREIGLTRFVSQNGDAPSDLWFFSHLPRRFNYEFEMAEHRRDHPAAYLAPLWDHEQLGSNREVRIELPGEEDMPSFDGLEIDLSMGCEDDQDRRCYEWDYKAHMTICAAPIIEDPPTDPCQAEVRDPDTNEVTTPAETTTCPCSSPWEGPVDGTRTCRNVTDPDSGEILGSEWGACSCACGPEIARWITSYHRPGRWLTDITPALAWMQKGGPARLVWHTSYDYFMSGELRFLSEGKPDRPYQALPLWGGGPFNSDYNPSRPPVEFEVPEGTTRAQVVAFITGHGFASDDANCAEFCPHAHHFQLNGGEVHTREFDEARDYLGCIEQIDEGTLPNQYGTWYLGRGGWCPGKDVPAYVADITDNLDFAGTNTIAYSASLNGNEPNNAGDIWMASFLVFYRD